MNGERGMKVALVIPSKGMRKSASAVVQWAFNLQ